MSRFLGVTIALMLIFATIIPSSAILGESGEIPAIGLDESEDQNVEPMVTPPAAPISAPEAKPWWIEWLDHYDQSGTRVDDRAENLALEHIEAGKPDKGVSVLLTYLDVPTDEDTARLMAEFGADPESLHVLSTTPTVLATLPAHQILRLGEVPGVAAVEWDYPLERVLTISAPATQAREYIGTGTNTIYNGMTGESLGYTGTGSVIAVIDTGIAETHPAFDGKMVATADSSTLATVECTVSHDLDGHGTHVASTAAGNPAGINFKGTAMDAGLVDVQITKQLVTIGGVQRGLGWVHRYNQAIDQGNPKCGVSPDDRIDVATVSFGSTDRGGPNAGSTETTINTLTSGGVVVTIAVGNCGPDPSALCDFGDVENGISSPGNAANAIGVAASGDGNSVDRTGDGIARFSSRGPNSAQCCTGNANPGSAGGATGASDLQDRYRKPDITAPGVGITAASHTGGYTSKSGTSMATPHVAGIAALLIQAGEEVKGDTGNVNLMLPTGSIFNAGGGYVVGNNPVRDAIMFGGEYSTEGMVTSAELAMLAKWEGPNTVGVTWNNAWGYGAVNAFDALCWAWDNVLEPGGAPLPATVANQCGLTINAGGPYEGTAEEPITFTASARGGKEPYTFEWDFGDGSTGTGGVVQHTYLGAGTYTVQLTVTDDEGTVETDVTAADVDTGPPFAQITNPEDGDKVQGNTTIEGIAGHVGDGTSTTQSTTLTSNGSDSGTESTVASGPTTLMAGSQALTLWFRGESVAGVGMPTADEEGLLSTQPPTGTVPVVHSGGDLNVLGSVTERVPVVLTSEPLGEEVLLGDEAMVRFHFAGPVRSAQHDLIVELRAVDGVDTRVLASGENTLEWIRADGVDSVEAPLDPTDEDRTLGPGERFQLMITTESSLFQSGLAYSILYDAMGFESHVEIEVMDGFPPLITSFSATPAGGDVPLDVSFNGTVEAGSDPITSLELDPGDGTAPFAVAIADGEFNTTHTYTSPGTWTPTVTAEDAEGRTGSSSLEVAATRATGVHVRVGDGPLVLAEDVSTGGNWSSWRITHDFSDHDAGSVVPIEAFFFDGEQESDRHGINVTVTNPSEVTIDHPEANTTLSFPANITGTYMVAGGTGENLTWGLDLRILHEEGNVTLDWTRIKEPANGTQGTWGFIWQDPPPEGVYNVEVRLREGETTRSTDTRTYFVENLPPVAVLDGPNSTVVGQQTLFSGETSDDPDGQIVSYHWDFGDGNNTQGEVVNHTWSQPGEYVVVLTVTDNQKGVGTVEHEIQVEENNQNRPGCSEDAPDESPWNQLDWPPSNESPPCPQ